MSKNPNVSYLSGRNIETMYTIEYIDNKQDYDMLEKSAEPWTLYSTIQTNNLQYAIELFLLRFTQTDFFYTARLFEQIVLDGEVIREQTINCVRNIDTVCDKTGERLRDEIQKMEENMSAIAPTLEDVETIKRRWGNDQWEKAVLNARKHVV